MKIVIAPDSFKGSASSIGIAAAIQKGIQKVCPHAKFDLVPIADGGEGTCEAVMASAAGEWIARRVTGPLGAPVDARYCMLKDHTAVIEMAAASGLTLVPHDELDPMRATSFGTGELIRDALERDTRRLIIGIGGSATNDGGAGMLQALGGSLRDGEGRELGFGGGELSKLYALDLSKLDPRIKECDITIACDVTNPLLGPKGASAVYGPQKGAAAEQVRILDQNLAHFARIVREATGIDAADREGAGAAGGLGYGLLVFLGASLKRGIDTMLDLAGFDGRIRDADLVITGEGRIDAQSAFGKVPAGVAARVKRAGEIPVVAFAGGIGEGAEKLHDLGVDAMVSIVDGAMELKTAMERALELTERCAERTMRLLLAGTKLSR
ncbi:MAG: glycerate kinase [Bacillota bacterium]